jgi:hypothetical protein
MKKVILPLLIILVISCNSFAQVDYQISSALDLFRSNQMATGDFSKTIAEENIDGSPYLNDDFINGTVFTTSKLQYVDIPLRYNIFNDDIEFRTNEDKVMAMATPEIIERVTFGEYEMVYAPFAVQKKIRRGFFKLVITGKISLYARPEILYQQPEEPGAYKEAKPAKFVNKPDTYYLRNGLNEAIKVDKKNDVIDFFPEHNNEVAAYIKKNKIKTNKEVDLKELVEYYNSNF